MEKNCARVLGERVRDFETHWENRGVIRSEWGVIGMMEDEISFFHDEAIWDGNPISSLKSRHVSLFSSFAFSSFESGVLPILVMYTFDERDCESWKKKKKEKEREKKSGGGGLTLS